MEYGKSNPWVKVIVATTLLIGLGQTDAEAGTNSGYGAQATISEYQVLQFKTLERLLIVQNINSVDSALPVLAAKYPEYLRFNTLMYGSLSIQASSFEEPRVLVFGPDARFIFTFNGSEHQKGGHSFETVEYSDQTHSFSFREIAFKYPGFRLSDLDVRPDEVAYENANMVITNSNPAKCVMCHGQNASPIWNSYFLWTGAYGSDDDQLGMSFNRSSWNPNNTIFFQAGNKPSSQGRRMSFKPGRADTELDGLARYAMLKPNHPRYKWLPATITEKAALQYSKGVPFSNLDFSRESASQQKAVNANREWPSRPNLFLLDALYRLNSGRLLARLERAGLRQAYVALPWRKLMEGMDGVKSDRLIGVAAKNIFSMISGYRFKHPMPTVPQIEAALRTNLREEFGMQLERIYRQDSLLGSGSLQFQPYFSTETLANREGMLWIQDAREFYTGLMGLRQWTELESIAAGIETDNQFLNTALALLLADEGIDLHEYNLNLRQMSLAFHTSGLNEAYEYLGVR